MAAAETLDEVVGVLEDEADLVGVVDADCTAVEVSDALRC